MVAAGGAAAVLGVLAAEADAAPYSHPYRGWVLLALIAFLVGACLWLVGKVSEKIVHRRNPAWLRKVKIVKAVSNDLDGLRVEVTNLGPAAEFEAEAKSIGIFEDAPRTRWPRSWRIRWEGETSARTTLLRGQTKTLEIASWDKGFLHDTDVDNEIHFHRPDAADINVPCHGRTDSRGQSSLWVAGFCDLHRVSPPARRAFFIHAKWEPDPETPRLWPCSARVAGVARSTLRRRSWKRIKMLFGDDGIPASYYSGSSS